MSRTDIILQPLRPAPATPKQTLPPAHHVCAVPGFPPTSFRNPWPSAQPIGLGKVLSTKFLRSADKNNISVPTDRQGLVPIRKPDWGQHRPWKLKATWIGHASWLVEMPSRSDIMPDLPDEQRRGVRILLDPVFSERTSPVQWFGPKRYSPTPCTVEEVPEIDIIAISHNHYDHLDSWTIKKLYRIGKEHGRTPLIACALGNKPFFAGLLPDLPKEDIIELDWWQGVHVNVKDIGSIGLVCTPAQHTSARSYNDKDKALWCSWTLQELIVGDKLGDVSIGRKLFFAGDTGYRYVDKAQPTPEEEAAMPHCPAFREVGEAYGPFDLALLPIGLYSPRDFMSSVHCAPEDAACMHKDLYSRMSVGMHYGTVRGGISAQYEDVLEPPARWKRVCEEKGLNWGQDVGLCDIGETFMVQKG